MKISRILEALRMKKVEVEKREKDRTHYKASDTSIFSRDAGCGINCSTATPKTDQRLAAVLKVSQRQKSNA